LPSEEHVLHDRHRGTQQYVTTQMVTVTHTWVINGLGTHITQLFTKYELVSLKKSPD